MRWFLRFAADRVALARAGPDTERVKDIWDLRVWGTGGRLSFVGGDTVHRNGRQPSRAISQAWLKEAAKAWAAEALVSMTSGPVRAVIGAVGLFSEYLDRRPDGGADPAALGHRDVEAFLARLARLEQAGKLSAGRRARSVDLVSRFLRDCREMGLTQPGAVLACLADAVVIRRAEHLPGTRRDDEVGRALPEAVMARTFGIRDALAVDWYAPISRALIVASMLLVAAGCAWTSADRLPGFRYLRTYVLRRLHPLWLALYEATPAIALEPPIPAHRDRFALGDLQMRLCRRVIEIRDGALVLHAFASPDLRERARAAAVALRVPADRIDPVTEAVWLEVARRAKLRGGDPPARAAFGESTGGADLASEVEMLEQVSRAYRRDSAVVAELADRLDGQPRHAIQRTR